MKKIKAIIFDVDGVVFNSLDKSGHYLWSKNIKTDLGLSSEHFKLIFSSNWDNVTRGKITINEHLNTVFRHEIFKDLKLNGLTPDTYIDYWLYHDNHVNAEMIDFTKKLAIPIYLGTNQDEYRTKHIIKQVGSSFAGCFSSYQIGHIKPEKEFFDYIEKKLQLQPNELFLIDDISVYIEGAKACGWNAFLYQNNLNDLKQFIEALF